MNFNNLIERLKDIVSKELGNTIVKDIDIAGSLDIGYSRFRKLKQRGTIPYKEIMQFLASRKISINWFFFDQLPESLIDQTQRYILLKYRSDITGSAGSGSFNYSIDFQEIVIDQKLLDHLKSSYKLTEIVRVLGESMEPDIKDNSFIFVDRSQTQINSRNIYLIRTHDGLFVKRVKYKEGRYFLASTNKSYKDIPVEDTFEVLGVVKGVFNKL